jgi:WD40 repeat protein
MIEQDTTRAESEHLLPPDAIQWHPDVERVYILYHNMRFVDWNPIFEEHSEYQIGAKEMVRSPCGKFLLTSDDRGAIRIFSLPDYVSKQDQKLRLINHLEYNELVRDLAFHPDGQRFYDIRGTICNIWEPDALFQADEPGAEEEGSSNAGSLTSSGPAEAFQDDCSQIAAIASGPKDFGFCCDRDDGTLSIHDMKCGKGLRSLPGHATDAAIIALNWSRSGNWIASAGASGHVLVRKVQIPSARNPNLLMWKASGFRVEDGSVQLLISPDDSYLLVVSSSSVRLWEV